MTIGVVVKSLEPDDALYEKRAVLLDGSFAFNVKAIGLGGRDRRKVKRLAERRRNEIRAVAKICGHNVAARLVGRIHKNVSRLVRLFAAGSADTRDRMIEIRERNFVVHLRARVYENGIRLEARYAEHRRKKRRLVAADAVAVLKSDVDVVRCVPG